jgi:hypothetical protein
MLRFAHPTALPLISDSSNPPAAPRARGFASSCAAKIQKVQGKPGALSTRGRPSARGERRQSRRVVATSHAIGGSPPRNCGRLTIKRRRRTHPSVPTGLLHSRAGLRQFFEPALDLGAGYREIVELAVVEPVQGDARGVTLVARDHRREEAVDETAPARQPDCGSPGKWSGGGGRNGGQYRHGYFLSRRSRKPVSLPEPFLSNACCQHCVSRLRYVRLKAANTGHGCVNDQNKEAMRSNTGRTSPRAMPRAARQATLRPDASSLTASVVSD